MAVGAGALLAPSALWLYPVFLLVGVNQGGGMLARLAGPMEFAPPDRLPTYVALSGALVSLVAAIAPLLAGVIVALLGYRWLFAISLLLSLAAVPMFRAQRSLRESS